MFISELKPYFVNSISLKYTNIIFHYLVKLIDIKKECIKI